MNKTLYKILFLLLNACLQATAAENIGTPDALGRTGMPKELWFASMKHLDPKAVGKLSMASSDFNNDIVPEAASLNKVPPFYSWRLFTPKIPARAISSPNNKHFTVQDDLKKLVLAKNSPQEGHFSLQILHLNDITDSKTDKLSTFTMALPVGCYFDNIIELSACGDAIIIKFQHNQSPFYTNVIVYYADPNGNIYKYAETFGVISPYISVSSKCEYIYRRFSNRPDPITLFNTETRQVSELYPDKAIGSFMPGPVTISGDAKKIVTSFVKYESGVISSNFLHEDILTKKAIELPYLFGSPSYIDLSGDGNKVIINLRITNPIIDPRIVELKKPICPAGLPRIANYETREEPGADLHGYYVVFIDINDVVNNAEIQGKVLPGLVDARLSKDGKCIVGLAYDSEKQKYALEVHDTTSNEKCIITYFDESVGKSNTKTELTISPDGTKIAIQIDNMVHIYSICDHIKKLLASPSNQ